MEDQLLNNKDVEDLLFVAEHFYHTNGFSYEKYVIRYGSDELVKQCIEKDTKYYDVHVVKNYIIEADRISEDHMKRVTDTVITKYDKERLLRELIHDFVEGKVSVVAIKYLMTGCNVDDVIILLRDFPRAIDTINNLR